MSIEIRDCQPDDIESVAPLFPRLAEFEVPNSRNPADLWEEDLQLLRQWGRGEAPQCFAKVAISAEGASVGVALVSLQQELLSHAPSAHLEALAIAAEADGQGVGRQLLHAAEQEARSRGAASMTLHVFNNNHRGRHVYQQQGYDEELIRCFKSLT